MRRLAASLSTGPSTLYWHVRDKDQLLALILDETIASVEVPDSGTWRERLFALLEGSRSALAARPALVPVVLGARWEIGNHALRIADASFALLSEAGIPQSAIGDAYFLLLHYTLGVVEAEAHARWNDSFAEEHAGRERSQVDGSELAAFPHLVAFGPRTRLDDVQLRFREGITTILDGLTVRFGLEAESGDD